MFEICARWFDGFFMQLIKTMYSLVVSACGQQSGGRKFESAVRRKFFFARKFVYPSTRKASLRIPCLILNEGGFTFALRKEFFFVQLNYLS